MTLFGNFDVLQSAEDHLKRSLEMDEASPFIAHHQVPDRQTLADAVSGYAAGDWRLVYGMFGEFPRVAVWTLATAIAENYGSEGGHEVYHHIASAFGFRADASQHERKKLRKAFRRASARLSLALPAEDELVQEARGEGLQAQAADDYFLQAGVAINQVHHLAELFYKGEEAFGPPPLESSDALARWERDCVLEFRRPGLARLPKVLLFDGTGYHAQQYGRLLQGDSPEGSLAQAMDASRRQLKQKGGARKGRGRTAPRLHCVDGVLLIQDSYGRGGFRGEFDGQERRVARGGNLLLPTPWPTEVICHPLGSDDGGKTRVEILPEGIDVLFFDADSGRLELAVELGKQPSVNVPKGEIAIASRMPFTVDGEESVGLEEGCFMAYADARRALLLQCDGQDLSIKPRARPGLRIIGEAPVARSGTSVLVPGLREIEVDYPLEAGDEGEIRLELRLTHPALRESLVVVPCVMPAGGGTKTIDVTDWLPRAGPMGRLRVALVEAGAKRNLCVESAWYWPGLESFEDGRTFRASSIPENLDLERSLHVQQEGDVIALGEPTATPYIEARLIFSEVGDESERQHPPLAEFRMPPPGVSVLQHDPTGRIRPLRPGHRLALAPGDGSTIEVRAPETSGRLDVRGENYDLDRFGRWRMSSTGIIRCGSQSGRHSRIRYHGPSSETGWVDLLHVVDVDVVEEFGIEAGPMWTRVKATLAREPQKVQVEVKGLRFGESATLNSFQVCYALSDGRIVSVRIDHSDLPRADIYLACMKVNFGDGRWRELTNARGDSYRWVIKYPLHQGVPIDAEPPHDQYLERMSEVLMDCAAEPCWPSIERDVLPEWKKRLSELRSDSRTLLQESVRRWPNDGSGSWVPIHHPLEAVIEAFSAPARCFEDIDEEEAMDGAAHIKYLSSISEHEGVREACGSAQISPYFLFGFRNVHEANRDPTLRLLGFQFDKYLAAIEAIPSEDRESLWTERQPRLTPSHHAWCAERFAERLTWVAIPGHNTRRIDRAVGLSMHLKRDLPRRKVGVERIAIRPPPDLVEELPPAVQALFELTPALLSYWARANRFGSEEVRDLASNLSDATDEATSSIARSLSFLIRLAPELFSFYLLLWELAAIGDRPRALKTDGFQIPSHTAEHYD